MSQRQAAKQFNISRDSVAKLVSYSPPPGYQRQLPIRRAKLDAFVSTIEHWLEEDLKVPRRQRHTSTECSTGSATSAALPAGGYTIIKDYMCEGSVSPGSACAIGASAGHGQADFGETIVVIGGVEQKAHGDGCYVRAHPAAMA